MRMAEEAAFTRGSSAEMLMDQAGASIARVVARFFPTQVDAFSLLERGTTEAMH